MDYKYSMDKQSAQWFTFMPSFCSLWSLTFDWVTHSFSSIFVHAQKEEDLFPMTLQYWRPLKLEINCVQNLFHPTVKTCGKPNIQNIMMNVTAQPGQMATFKCQVRVTRFRVFVTKFYTNYTKSSDKKITKSGHPVSGGHVVHRGLHRVVSRHGEWNRTTHQSK